MSQTAMADTKIESGKKIQRQRPLHKGLVTWMVILHVGALTALFKFSWGALLLCLVLHWVTGGLGITLGYHRLLTHRSFTVPKPLEYLLTLFACLAGQGGPISWVGTHRYHHLKSDLNEDPHTPKHGFWWAHMGWCMSVYDQIATLDKVSRFAPDLAKDPGHRFLEKTHFIWMIGFGVLLFAIGGWHYVAWAFFLRMVLVYHSTWLVNSAAHVWGYQTYKSNDDSKNLWWVALLSYGEGWHNNHHAFQTSARHGLKWWELDTTYSVVQFFKLLGLAKDIKLPSQHLLGRAALAA